MKTVKSQSTTRPPEWDTESSPEVVYHNFDVEEVAQTEEAPAMFDYTQEQYSRLEYAQKQAQDAAGRADALETAMLAIMDAGVV